jgi:hypothetical protein
MSQHLYGVGHQEDDSDAGKRPFCAVFPALQHRLWMDSADGLIEAAEATGNPYLLAWALAA